MKMIRLLLSLLAVIVLVDCSTSITDHSGEENQSKNPMDSFDEVNLAPCETRVLSLDTTTVFQNLVYEPEGKFLGYEMKAMHATIGQGEMGYVVLAKDSQLTLCLINWENGYKIIGVTNIQQVKANQQFVDFCASSCADNFKTFGIVEEIKFGEVKTHRAWKINDKDRQMEEIGPTAVDCRKSFYTDYD